MIEVTNTAAQTILPGGTVTFDKVLQKSGCGECYNPVVPSSVKLCAKGLYSIDFNANITASAATTPIVLSLAIGGSPMPQTTMNATPAAAGDLVNVSAGTRLKVCCCDLDRITVVNTGTNPIVIAPNSSLRIARLA